MNEKRFKQKLQFYSVHKFLFSGLMIDISVLHLKMIDLLHTCYNNDDSFHIDNRTKLRYMSIIKSLDKILNLDNHRIKRDVSNRSLVKIYEYDRFVKGFRGQASKHTRVICGYKVKMGSIKLRCLKIKGFTCKYCGIDAEFMAIDKTVDGNFFINFYGVDEYGHDVMMTVDHIYPKAHGGKNLIHNLATTCSCCNLFKGNKIPTLAHVHS